MLNDTVTSAVVATDKVAVSVKDDPAFSAIDVALVVNVTVGADSFSVIVIVTAVSYTHLTLPTKRIV